MFPMCEYCRYFNNCPIRIDNTLNAEQCQCNTTQTTGIYPSCPTHNYYIVKEGDTIESISCKNNISVDELLQANLGVDSINLYVDQYLCIPTTDFYRQNVNVVDRQSVNCPMLNLYVVNKGDTYYSIAKYFNTSVSALQRLNPRISPYQLLPGMIICIPLTRSPVRISIDIKNKTLSLFKDNKLLKKYPVATGKPTTPTPVGTFTIMNKQVNPGGPFGTRWMGLSQLHYGIHGTNKYSSIGTAASNGCIRMYNEDVNELFNLVPVGTVVNIFDTKK